MKAEGKRDAPLVILFVAFFFYLGIQTPYHSPWLASQGIDRATIAMIGTGVLVSNTLGQILLPLLSSRWGVARLLTGAAAAAAPVTLLFLLFHSPLALTLIACFAGFAAGAIIPLADAEALRRPGLAYGQVRLFGSVGFGAAALIGGMFIDFAGARVVILLEAAALAVAAGASLCILARGTVPQPRPARLPFRDSLSSIASLRLWLLIIGVALINASHAYYYLFANIDWAVRNHLSSANLGMLWAIGIAAEIAVMAFYGRQESRYRALALMLAGAAGAALRWTGNAFHPSSFTVLCALQLLHGLSFAATLLGGIQMLRRLVPVKAASPALGAFAAMVHGVVIGIVSACLAQTSDSEAVGYPLMAMIALLGGAVILLLAWQTRNLAVEPSGSRPNARA